MDGGVRAMGVRDESPEVGCDLLRWRAALMMAGMAWRPANALSAKFEHTVSGPKDGFEVLTSWLDGSGVSGD